MDALLPSLRKGFDLFYENFLSGMLGLGYHDLVVLKR